MTVRWLGTFLDDPLDVPAPVLEFVAGQLGVADPPVVNKYGERVKTLSDHQLEIRRAEGLRDFTEAQDELAAWVAARSWTSGDGPKAIFLDAIGVDARSGRSCCPAFHGWRGWSRGCVMTRRTGCGACWRR